MSDMRLGMFVDLAKCIGCNACVVACKMENETPRTKFNTWVESWDVIDGNGRICRSNVPKQCNHCTNPACVEVCPVEASYIAEDGTVQIDLEKCIGCGLCMQACPYEARWKDEEAGKVQKCTFCHHRSSQGMMPACVGACVAGARVFGDLNDPESDVNKAIAAAGQVDVLLPEAGLEPAICFAGLNAALEMTRVSNIHQGGNVKVAYEGR